MLRILTFQLSGKSFGIDIHAVKEINRRMEFVPIPGASNYLAGLYNMRGQIVTLFNLDQILCLERSDQIKTNCVILKNSFGISDYAGFLIDKPGDVLDIDEEAIEQLPANADKSGSKYIKGIIKLKHELIALIEPASLTYITDDNDKE